MKRLIVIAALAVAGSPAFAQMEVTCGDYTLMDNAKQMETLAALEFETSQMATEQQLIRRGDAREARGGVRRQGRRADHRRDQGRVTIGTGRDAWRSRPPKSARYIPAHSAR